jgi:hypothetical protein
MVQTGYQLAWQLHAELIDVEVLIRRQGSRVLITEAW